MPSSRYSYFDEIDTVPFAYAAGGIKRIMGRAEDETSKAALEEYGIDGLDYFPLYYTPFAANGNYMEPNSIAVRHSVCGGPRLVSAFLAFDDISLPVVGLSCLLLQVFLPLHFVVAVVG